MEPSRWQQGVFSVEVYLRLHCPQCRSLIKRRLVEYLISRSSTCSNCSAKLVHLARGQTTNQGQMDLNRLQEFIAEVESQWSSVVNETLTLESSGFSLGD